jgi:SAM-dependent methyltransferase
MDFSNRYDDATRAESYARLEFANTYYLAYRDIPAIVREHIRGARALDFGCGTGRSTRFLRRLGFDTVGVDIAQEMVAKAKELDPGGDYRILEPGNLGQFQRGAYDLVLSAFTFDNVPGMETKVRLFRDLGMLLNDAGKMINVVSAPEIYLHEWASFSTRDFPENRSARSGDVVRIVTTDFPDRRPMEDILWTHESYLEVYDQAGLEAVATYKPLAQGGEPYPWVNETAVAPWVIYVLRRRK